MPNKLPNYTFSRDKDREVSPTEARLSSLLRRLSSTRKRRGTPPKPMTTMSAPPSAQTSLNGPVDGNTPANPNAQDDSTLSAVDFGDLHHKVREDVGRFEAGTELVKNAILNLATVFREEEEIVRVVRERWNSDQDLKGEIRRLNNANQEMWNLRHKEEEQLKAKISELKEAAESGEKQKRTYEWKAVELKDEYKQKDQTLKRSYEEARSRDRKELEEKKAQLESDNADKIAVLERQKIELEDRVAKLQRDLGGKQKELDKERENDKRIQESLSKDIGTWKTKYEKIMVKYAAEEHPPEYYVGSYQRIADRVKQISGSYFTKLPESALENPAAASDRLAKRSVIFQRTPILESQCSLTLRLANVEHLIFEVICGDLWQPFVSEHLLKIPAARSVIEDIYSRLATEGDQVQRNWKVSTLRILDKLDEASDSSAILDSIVGDVTETLQPLLDDRQVTQCQGELRQLFIKAIELGKITERDRLPVQISRTPSLNDSDGWLEFSKDLYEAGDTTSSSTPLEPPSALYVTPKVYLPATAGVLEQVLHAGSALFPHTRIIQEGREDWERIRKAHRDMAQTIARERKSSTSSTAMVSPTWPGNGAVHFEIGRNASPRSRARQKMPADSAVVISGL